MKKIWIIAIIVSIFVLSSCGAEAVEAGVFSTPESTATPNPTHEITPMPTPEITPEPTPDPAPDLTNPGSGQIFNNIIINGVDIGGLDKSSALEKINIEIIQPLKNRTIVFSDGNTTQKLTFLDFYSPVDVQAAVDAAYALTHGDSAEENTEKALELLSEPMHIDLKMSCTADTIKKAVDNVAAKFYIAPVNASCTPLGDGEFAYNKEIAGSEMDVDNALQQVNGFLIGGTSGEVLIERKEVAPRYTVEDCLNATCLLGSFTTYFKESEKNRTINIKLAAEHINGIGLAPGEVFSTVKAIGPTNASTGFKSAPTIQNGRLVDGIGGGICQVSSTLYNAVLYAELEIIARTNHSIKVSYLDYGYDATLSGTAIDLQFRNNTDAPVSIEAFVNGDALTVNLYGRETREQTRRLEFETKKVSTIKPGADIITYDSSLAEGKRVVTLSAKNGYKYELYKLVYIGETLQEKILVNTSNYKAVRAEIKIGSKPAASTAPLAPEPTVQPEIDP